MSGKRAFNEDVKMFKKAVNKLTTGKAVKTQGWEDYRVKESLTSGNLYTEDLYLRVGERLVKKFWYDKGVDSIILCMDNKEFVLRGPDL